MISFRSIFYIAFAIFLALSHSVSIADGIDLPSSHTTTLVFPTAGNSKITDLSVDIFAALVPEIEASSLQLLSIDNAQSAIELVQKRPDYIIAGLPQLSDIKNSFSWVGPIYSLRPVVIVENENEKGIRIAQPSDLSEYHVGILAYDNTVGIVSELVSQNHIVNAETFPELFALLASGEIDVIIAEHLYASEYLTERYALGDYEFIFFLPPVPHYYVFAGDTDPEIIASYQNALDTIKTTPSNGDVRYTQYEEIVSKNVLPSTFRSSHYVLIFSSYGESISQVTKMLSGMNRIFSSSPNIRYDFEDLCIDCQPTSSPLDITAYAALVAEAAMNRYPVPDTIVSIGFEAFHAAQQYASSHDSNIPIIYGMPAPGRYRSDENSGILWTYEIGKLIHLAKQMHPGRDVIYVISSQDHSNQLVLEKIREIDALDAKSIFYYAPYDLSLEDLIQDINAHNDAIVLLHDYKFYDGSRSFYLTNENVNRLTSSISAPVYTLTDVFSHDTAVVEGYQTSMERIGELLGIMTSRVLFGEEIGDIPTYIYSPLPPEQETKSSIPTLEDVFAVFDPNSPYFPFILLTVCLLIITGIWLFIQRKISHTLADMRRSQSVLKKRIQSMPVAIAVFPLDSYEHIFINEAMYHVIDSGFTYYIDASYEEFVKIKNNVAQNGETYEGERESATGKQIFHFYVHPIHDSMGSVQLIMIQAINVTEAREKERETCATLDLLNQFVEQNVAGVAFFHPIYDQDGKLKTGMYYKVNREFSELLHLYSEDVRGKELGGFLTREDVLELFWTLTDTSPPARFSYLQSEDDREFLSGFVFKIGINPPLFCLSLTDETESYYHRLIEMSATQKLEAMLKEIAILNDQIRNPLTVILCSLEVDTIHAHADFKVQIHNINTAIDQLDRRFLVVDSLRARIKEKEHMRTGHAIIEFVSASSYEAISAKEDVS